MNEIETYMESASATSGTVVQMLDGVVEKLKCMKRKVTMFQILFMKLCLLYDFIYGILNM